MSTRIRNILSMALLLVAMGFFSCETPALVTPSIVSARPETSSRPSLGPKLDFPLAVGNRWVYLDSVFTVDDDTMIQYDTIAITGTRTDGFGTWWEFSASTSIDSLEENRILYPVIDELLDLHDTLFILVDSSGFQQSRQYRSNGSIREPGSSTTSYPCLSPVYVRALTGRTVSFKSHLDHLWCDTITMSAGMVPGTVRTPAGDWDNCVMYSWANGWQSEIIKPGIGIVSISGNSWAPYGLSWCGTGAEWCRAYLASYQINNERALK